MINIEIKEGKLNRREITSKKDGKQMVFLDQEAYAYTVDKQGKLRDYPEACRISLDIDQVPYPPGLYVLQPSSIYVDRFGALALSRPKLKPFVSQPMPKAS